MEDKMIIQSLKIEGFWGKYNINVNFNEDVNILTGVNGSGKTTIMDIMYSLLNKNPENHRVRKKYKSAKLTFCNDSSVEIGYDSDNQNFTRYTINGDEVNYDVFEYPIRYTAVSNFDTNIPNEDIVKRLQEKNPNIFSELDVELNRWLNLYSQYMTLISRQVDSLLKNGGLEIEKINDIYSLSRKMENLCNKLLKNKTWHISDKEGTVEFILNDGDKHITPEQLSSGEKQMLILLISTLIQNEKTGIVFWDEPEVSLHIAWQQQLIRVMRMLNPNMQMIIATHSPNLLYEGWESRILNVQDLMHDGQN